MTASRCQRADAVKAARRCLRTAAADRWATSGADDACWFAYADPQNRIKPGEKFPTLPAAFGCQDGQSHILWNNPVDTRAEPAACVLYLPYVPDASVRAAPAGQSGLSHVTSEKRNF